MNPCETRELAISVMVDGELDADDVALTVDHLLSCDSCRDFYRECRALDRTLRPLRPALARERTPSHASPSPRRPPRPFGGSGIRRGLAPRWRSGRVAAAAAIVILGLGTAWVLRPGAVTPADAPRGLVIERGERQEAMSEAHFLELAVELLEAEPRYQQEMLHALRQVQSRTFAEEGSFAATPYRSDVAPGARELARRVDRNAEDAPVSTHVY